MRASVLYYTDEPRVLEISDILKIRLLRDATCTLCYVYTSIEVLNVKPGVSILLLFASLQDCSQNQIAVSDT